MNHNDQEQNEGWSEDEPTQDGITGGSILPAVVVIGCFLGGLAILALIFIFSDKPKPTPTAHKLHVVFPTNDPGSVWHYFPYVELPTNDLVIKPLDAPGVWIKTARGTNGTR